MKSIRMILLALAVIAMLFFAAAVGAEDGVSLSEDRIATLQTVQKIRDYQETP